MLALAARILALVPAGFLDRYLDHLARRTDQLTERRRIAADLAAEQIRAEIARRDAQRDLTIAEGGRWFTALHRSIFIYPTGLYYAAIVADSLFRFDWDVAALPAPYSDWGFAIVGSLFLVDGAQMVTRTLAASRR